MVLGDDGIIKNAQAAKESNEKAYEKDMVAIAKAEAATLKHTNQQAMSKEELEALIKEDGTTPLFDFGENEYNKSVAKVTEDGVPIPLGFAHVQGTTKDEGLIVVDGYGNEFVWVPVETFSDFAVLQDDGINYRGQLWATGSYDFGTKNTTYNANSGLREPAVVTNGSLTDASSDGNDANKNAILESKYKDVGLLSQFQAEYNAMAKSVKTYGGFYVGRYETSWTGSKVASVQGATPTKEEGKNEIFKSSTDLGTGWTTAKTGANENKATWYGLYKYQKELYNKDTDSVVSGMIYGAEWDAIMNWMSDVKNPNGVNSEYYIYDSTGMGHYCYDENGNLLPGYETEEEVLPANTASDSAYAVKNIYDLAGNYWEWTQEAGHHLRALRGGVYSYYSTEGCASYRFFVEPENASIERYSSRLQLYIK